MAGAEALAHQVAVDSLLKPGGLNGPISAPDIHLDVDHRHGPGAGILDDEPDALAELELGRPVHDLGSAPEATAIAVLLEVQLLQPALAQTTGAIAGGERRRGSVNDRRHRREGDGEAGRDKRPGIGTEHRKNSCGMIVWRIGRICAVCARARLSGGGSMRSWRVQNACRARHDRGIRRESRRAVALDPLIIEADKVN